MAPTPTHCMASKYGLPGGDGHQPVLPGGWDSDVIEEALHRDLGLDLLDRLWAANDLDEADALPFSAIPSPAPNVALCRRIICGGLSCPDFNASGSASQSTFGGSRMAVSMSSSSMTSSSDG
jgi:hypothetical protein